MPLPSPLSYISAVTRADCWVILTPYGWLLATHRKQQLSTLQTTFIIGKAFITTLRHPTYWIRTMEGLWQERSSSLCVVQLLTLPKLTFDLKKCGKLYVFNSPPPQGGNFLTLFFSTLNPSLSGNILYLPLDSAQSSVHVLLFIQLGRWSHMWLEWGAGR